MNMLIGVLCEVVTQVASSEKEMAAVATMKQTLLVMLKEKDADGSGEISKEEWRAVLADPAARDVLEQMDVDVSYLLEVDDMLYDKNPSVSIGMIMDLMLSARGDRDVTMKDLLDVNTFTHWMLEFKFEELMNSMGVQP